MLPQSLCAVGDVLIGLLVDPAPGSTLPGGVLGLPEPDLSVLAWAVLLSESEARPMLKSKMAHFAGLPRATLYRKLDELAEAGVVETDGIGRVRVLDAYLSSDGLDRALARSVAIILDFRRRSDPGLRSLEVRIAPDARRLATIALVGRLVLDLARLSHCHAETWFSTRARYWVVRWLVLQAQGRGTPATPAELSRRTGLSRATIHRQVAEIDRLGVLRRGLDRSLEIDPALYARPDLQMTIATMENKIKETIHSLSELDTNYVERA